MRKYARPETLDDEGVPDLDGPLADKAATGDPQEGGSPPSTKPESLDYGTTVEEQRRGEPIGVRVEREQPDLDADDEAPPADPETPVEAKLVEVADESLAEPADDAAGFELVRPEDEDVGLADSEKDESARRVDPGELAVPPEGAALHVEADRERP